MFPMYRLGFGVGLPTKTVLLDSIKLMFTGFLGLSVEFHRVWMAKGWARRLAAMTWLHDMLHPARDTKPNWVIGDGAAFDN